MSEGDIGFNFDPARYFPTHRGTDYEMKADVFVILVGAQVGLDPVEALDFFLGVLTIDLVGDDYDGFPTQEFADLVRAMREGKDAEAEAIAGSPTLAGSRDPHRRTALHWAAHFKSAEAVEQLLANGATVDAKDNFGRTPLYFAATTLGVGNPNDDIRTSDDNDQILRVETMLLKAGAQITADSRHGVYRPFRNAVRSRQLDRVVLYLEHGADVNVKDDRDLRALDWVDERFDKEMFDFLINPGAKRALDIGGEG